MKAIIICGLPAAGKTTVARMISERLKIPTLGGTDILKEMAKERGYHMTGDDWWDTQEGMKFLKERETNPEFDKETDRRLIARINKGDVVVTSWTAPWLAEDGFRIWLTAKEGVRSSRMSQRDNTQVKEAEKVLRERERENYSLYKKIYNIEFGKDLKPFDLIIETDNIPAEQVADMILVKFKEFDGKK